MAIVKANYVPRKRAVKAAGRAANYYTFREGRDQAQRVWYDKDGQTMPYADVRSAIREQARTWGYTYRVILSTKEADLPPEDYRAVLGAQFADYYFIQHHNTDHPHAHVIGFTKTRMKRPELKAMLARLQEVEQARAQEQTHAREAEQAHVLELGSPAPARRVVERDDGLDLFA